MHVSGTNTKFSSWQESWDPGQSVSEILCRRCRQKAPGMGIFELSRLGTQVEVYTLSQLQLLSLGQSAEVSETCLWTSCLLLPFFVHLPEGECLVTLPSCTMLSYSHTCRQGPSGCSQSAWEDKT